MTRNELIKFLEENYEPDTELIWQTISFEDVANGIESGSLELWKKFIEQQEYYGELAEKISEDVFNEFFEFVENYKPESDN